LECITMTELPCILDEPTRNSILLLRVLYTPPVIIIVNQITTRKKSEKHYARTFNFGM